MLRTAARGGSVPQPSNSTRFALEIILHRAVVIEMVAREIGEDGNVKRDAKNALLLERVR